MMQNPTLISALLLVLYTDCVFPCTYPWGAGPWKDTLGRSITFNTNMQNMEGYDLSYTGTSFSTWTCLLKTGDLILSRTLSTGNVAGDDYYLYACMLVNTVSSSEFYYHLMSENDRDVIKANTTLRIAAKKDSETVTDICTICAQNPSSISLPVTEYTVMTSDGSSTDESVISNPSFAHNPCDPSTTTTEATTTTQATNTTEATNTTQPLTSSGLSGLNGFQNIAVNLIPLLTTLVMAVHGSSLVS